MFDLTLGSDPGSLLSNLRRRILSSSPQLKWSTSHFLFLAQLLVLCFDHQVHLDVHLMPLIRQPATFFTSPSPSCPQSLPSPPALPTRSTWISIFYSLLHEALSTSPNHGLYQLEPVRPLGLVKTSPPHSRMKSHQPVVSEISIIILFYHNINDQVELVVYSCPFSQCQASDVMWSKVVWCVKKVAVAEEIVAWKIRVDDLWRHRKPPILTVLHNLLQNGLTSFERGRASWKLW